VIGTASSYVDLRAAAAWAPVAFDAPAALVAAAQRAFPAAVSRRIGTSAAVGGTAGIDGIEVEAMEGFAVLRAAAMAGVPAIEVRAISNAIEESDRSRWAFDEAFAAITEATPMLVTAIAAVLDSEQPQMATSTTTTGQGVMSQGVGAQGAPPPRATTEDLT
jgi:hypothetical protein